MTERPLQKDTLMVADYMAQLVRLCAVANGMNKNRVFSLCYNGAKWFEIHYYDVANGETVYIAERDSAMTKDIFQKAVDKMLEIVTGVAG